MNELIFYFILPIIAVIYAAVGHGGASGYLALMALFSFVPDEMKPTALTLNLFVAGISFLHFQRRGHFKLKLFLAFAVTSVPLAYLGGRVNIEDSNYKVILGIFLIVAVIKIIGLLDGVLKKENADTAPRDANIFLSLLLGGMIGFVSGIIGIGGGIILSPIILLMRWGTAKESAAVAALFIWVNSASGLTGQLMNGAQLNENWWIMVILVVVGGFMGGLIGSKLLDNKKLRYLLGFVLILAAIKLIFA